MRGKYHWVSFKETEIVDSMPYAGPRDREIFPVRCWLNEELQLQFVWATHGDGRANNPRKSKSFLHAKYDFKQRLWTKPELIWSAPEGETFNWSIDDGPSLSHNNGDVYTVFEISDYRFGIAKWGSEKQHWEVSFVELVDYTYSNGYTTKFRMGGFPSILVTSSRDYYIVYMTDYEIEIDEDKEGWGKPKVDVYMIKSSDAGKTWSEPIWIYQTMMGGAERPDIWMSNGVFHVIWYEQIFGEWDDPGKVGYSYSTDAGSTWSAPVHFSPTLSYVVERTYCSNEDGRAHLVIGGLFPDKMDYFTLQDGAWNWITDFSEYAEPYHSPGLFDPALACDAETAYLFTTMAHPLDSTISKPVDFPDRFLVRLDTLQTKGLID